MGGKVGGVQRVSLLTR